MTNDEPSARESSLTTQADGSSSNRQESSSILETSFSSLIALLRDKEDELKLLRNKAESIHQHAYHTERLERTRLEYKLQTMDIEHQHALKVHQIELDAALAQKNAAWNQISTLAEKHRAEIQALKLEHAAELERVRQATYPMTTSMAQVRAPRYAAPQHASGMVTQVPPLPRVDESARKDLKKADPTKMDRLKSAGDSVSTATRDQAGPNPLWRDPRDAVPHIGMVRRDGEHDTKFAGIPMNTAVQTRRHEEGIEDSGLRAQYQQSIRVGNLQNEVSALTLLTFEHEVDAQAELEKNQPNWLRRGDQAVRPNMTQRLPTMETQLPRSEPPVVTALTIHAPKRIVSGSVTPFDPTAAVTSPDTNMRLLNPVPPSEDDGNTVDEGHFSTGDNSTSVDDDDRSDPSEVSTSYGEDQEKVVDRVLSDPYGDRGVYTGTLLLTTGMPHGSGRIQYADVGRSYDGEWRYGRWYGFGRATFSNGDTYEGMYINDKREGPGVYKWRDGRVYDGEFKDDKRHGKGTFIWPDGSLYDGDFFHGQRDGHGIYQYADGGRYEGGWQGGKYSGVGTCVWVDGRKYHGEWKAGQCNGQGVETLPDGTIRHEGLWVNDEPLIE